VAILATCSSSIPAADDLTGLIRSLQAGGFDQVEQHDTKPLEARFFSIPGVAVVVPGHRLIAFKYLTESQTSEMASLVSGDGFGIGSKYVSWEDTPHFFSRGRLIVVCDGSEPKILSALEQALGPQFAGG